MNHQKDLLKTLIDLLDGIVEVFLSAAVKPLLSFHTAFDDGLDQILRQLVSDHQEKIPKRVGFKTVAYARVFLALPTIIFLSWGHFLTPALLVIVVHLAAYLERAIADLRSDSANDSGDESQHGLASGSAEEDSFEVVTTGSPQTVASWVHIHRSRVWASFVSEMVDRAFVVACLISLLYRVRQSYFFQLPQYLTMTSLIAMEMASGCLSFSKFFTTDLVTPPPTEDVDLSNSAIDPVQLRKIKRTLEYLGLVSFILVITKYCGLIFLMLVIPLAYESVREQGKKRVLYHVSTTKSFDHKTLKGWMQMKSLSSKLIVGVPDKDAMDMVLNACASNVVDEVVVEAPTKADLMFLEKQGIDYVILTPGQTNLVTDEVVNANRVLVLGDYGHLRRLQPKVQHKD